MSSPKIARLVVIVAVLAVSFLPGLGRAHGSLPHVVSFVSTQDPTFTFFSVGQTGFTTYLREPMTVTCVNVYTFDLEHQLVRASARSQAGYTFYFTFYGNGLLDASITTSRNDAFACGAEQTFNLQRGVGVIAY